MTIAERALEHPNRRATKEFVEDALNELVVDIEYIEKRYHVILIDERAAFNSARISLEGLPYAQVASIVADWKKTIHECFDEYRRKNEKLGNRS